MSFITPCENCNTIMKPVEKESGSLMLECRTCGFTKENENAVINKKIYTQTTMTAGSNVNQYLAYDNTLSHTKKHECPNAECPSKKDKAKQDAVFYTDQNTLKLNFICTVCKTFWHM